MGMTVPIQKVGGLITGPDFPESHHVLRTRCHSVLCLPCMGEGIHSPTQDQTQVAYESAQLYMEGLFSQVELG